MTHRQRHNPEEDLDPDLTIPRLEVPEFRAVVRPEDADNLSQRDRQLVLAVSVVEQKLDFLIEALVSNNRQARFLEGRLVRVEKWRRKLSGPINVFLWFATACTPFLLQRLFEASAK